MEEGEKGKIVPGSQGKSKSDYFRDKFIISLLGGAVASWLVGSSPERVVRARALAGDIVLCSWARQNLTNCGGMTCDGLASSPGGVGFMLQKPGISSGSYGPGPLGSKDIIL